MTSPETLSDMRALLANVEAAARRVWGPEVEARIQIKRDGLFLVCDGHGKWICSSGATVAENAADAIRQLEAMEPMYYGPDALAATLGLDEALT